MGAHLQLPTTSSIMRSPVLCFFVAYIATKIRVCLAEDKIVGGTVVKIKNFPYQVSLQYLNRHCCGGSIISSQWILSAAHCVHGMDDTRYSIRAGSSYHDQGGTIHNVTTIIHHPKYDTDTLDYDISVIKVKPSLELGSKADTIKLATKDTSIAVGTKVIISGWGFYFKFFGLVKKRTKQLRAVKIPVISTKECRRVTESVITDRMICAGKYFGGKGSCHGDSGGPMVTRGVQVGIVSWGVQCVLPAYPTVYARVSVLREWISDVCGV